MGAAPSAPVVTGGTPGVTRGAGTIMVINNSGVQVKIVLKCNNVVVKQLQSATGSKYSLPLSTGSCTLDVLDFNTGNLLQSFNPVLPNDTITIGMAITKDSAVAPGPTMVKSPEATMSISSMVKDQSATGAPTPRANVLSSNVATTPTAYQNRAPTTMTPIR